MLLTIEKLVYGGDGLARLPADEHGRGKAAFLPFVLSGEEVEATITEEKPGFVRAAADKIAQHSPHRVEPQCPYFQRCGGCHYQHAAYEHQLEIKSSILKENLRRIARLELPGGLALHPSPPWNYRNRTRLKVHNNPQFALGYYKLNSHDLLPVEQCPISSPLINQAIAAVRQLGASGIFPGGTQEIELFAGADDASLLCEVHCGPATATSEAEVLARELEATIPSATGTVVFKAAGGEPQAIATAGSSSLTYTTPSARYRVSAGAFFQVNRHLVSELASIVTQGQTGQLALDLYSGGGFFSVELARTFAQVIAVESSQISHSDLAYNSPANVKPVRAQVETYLENMGNRLRPDLVVVDPPRNGMTEKVARRLAALAAPRLIYVSCDPATLARDLKGLTTGGYRVEQAHLVDLFPQTYHLESVVYLSR